MECIRFPLVTGEELVDVVEKEDFMSTDPQCHKFILEAYQYAILPNRQHLMQTPRTQVIMAGSVYRACTVLVICTHVSLLLHSA